MFQWFHTQTFLQETSVQFLEKTSTVVCDFIRPVPTDAPLQAQTANLVMEGVLEEIKPKQARKSILHPDCPSTDISPLLSECDSSSEEEQGPDMAESLTGMEASRMTTDQQINTIAVNLKVSRELLLQCNENLDSVETFLQQNCKFENQVDLCASSSISKSTTGRPEIIGPPSGQYGLLLHKGYQWAENLEVQLMTGNWELLEDEELALWMHHYPLEQSQNDSFWKKFVTGTEVADSFSDGAAHDKDELSQYETALCDSGMTSGNQEGALSFQEKADVTPELSRPVDTEHQLLNAQSEHEDFSDDSEETNTDASVHWAPAFSAPSTNMVALDMSLVVELPSISCSPCLPVEKHNRPAPLCNSTPLSTDIQQLRMVHVAESYLQEFSASSLFSSVDVCTQSFNTAVDEIKHNTINPEYMAAKLEGEEIQKEESGGFKKKQIEEKQKLMNGSDEKKPWTHPSEQDDEKTDERMETRGQGQHRAGQDNKRRDYILQWQKEVKPREDDADEDRCASGDSADPEKKEEFDLLPGTQQSSFLEDTHRAHSTLDDLLRGFVMVEIGKSYRTREHVTKLRHLFETYSDDGRAAGGATI